MAKQKFLNLTCNAQAENDWSYKCTRTCHLHSNHVLERNMSSTNVPHPNSFVFVSVFSNYILGCAPAHQAPPINSIASKTSYFENQRKKARGKTWNWSRGKFKIWVAKRQKRKEIMEQISNKDQHWHHDLAFMIVQLVVWHS